MTNSNPNRDGSPTEEQRSASAFEASGEEKTPRSPVSRVPKKKRNRTRRRRRNLGGRRPKAKTKRATVSTVPPAAANALRCSLCRLTFTSGNALHKHLKEAHSGTHKKKR
jgi:DnaJ family protein A protein 5